MPSLYKLGTSLQRHFSQKTSQKSRGKGIKLKGRLDSGSRLHPRLCLIKNGHLMNQINSIISVITQAWVQIDVIFFKSSYPKLSILSTQPKYIIYWILTPIDIRCNFHIGNIKYKCTIAMIISIYYKNEHFSNKRNNSSCQRTEGIYFYPSTTFKQFKKTNGITPVSSTEINRCYRSPSNHTHKACMRYAL